MFRSLSTGAIGVQVDNLADGLSLAQRYGFQGYHFSIAEVAAVGVAQAQDWSEEAGVRLSAWGFPTNFRQDEAAYETDMKKLPELARIAAELGVVRTATWIAPASDELTYEENFRLHVARLAPAAAVLADFGIRLGLEYVGPKTAWSSKKHPFAHTMEQMGQLCQAVGENVGFLLDSWHWYTSEESIADLRNLSAHQIVDVHVNDAPDDVGVDRQIDSKRMLPGETGVIDLTGFLSAIKALGYDGPVMVEPFSERVRQMERDEAVAATGSALSAVWKEAGI